MSSRSSFAASCLLCLFLLLGGCSADAVDPVNEDPGLEYPSLKSLAPYGVGMAIQSGHTLRPDRRTLIEHAFDQITAEYEMKMNPMSTGPMTYNWSAADNLVTYAREKGLKIHGHTLIWHSTIPGWVNSYGGTDAQFEEAIRTYITATVQRYSGDVISWDVVNEAFEDNTGNLRNNVFSRRMGPDYLARMFQYARAADPDVLLFYNDYATIWDSGKRQAMLAMVDDFQSRGIPIDGVGLQMHVSYNFPSISDIETTMNELVSRGLKVHISELDVRANPAGDLTELTASRSQAQKARYKAIVAAYGDLPLANQFAITVWGLRDPDSWLIDFWGNPEWPLLFDGNNDPKPAYDGFVEALQETN